MAPSLLPVLSDSNWTLTTKMNCMFHSHLKPKKGGNIYIKSTHSYANICDNFQLILQHFCIISDYFQCLIWWQMLVVQHPVTSMAGISQPAHVTETRLKLSKFQDHRQRTVLPLFLVMDLQTQHAQTHRQSPCVTKEIRRENCTEIKFIVIMVRSFR